MLPISGECRNLGDYCERMKERFWPDWDECITHGGTKEATKWKPMMTSSSENISVLLALCEGNSSVTGEFPS